MKITLKRIYLRDDCTIGCLQVFLSGNYESQFLSSSDLKPSPYGGGWWLTLCDTLEGPAIPWEDKPLIGQKAGIPHAHCAIPEGTYRLVHHKTKKQKIPRIKICYVPFFKTAFFVHAKEASELNGGIAIGERKLYKNGHVMIFHSVATRQLLSQLLEEAFEHGEVVTMEVRSHKGWTAPL